MVKWVSIRILMTLFILKYCHTLQLEFVMAYPQAPIDFDLYLDLPHGVDKKEVSNNMHVLKLLKNLYGYKQVGRVWNQYLFSGLTNLRSMVSAVDECILYQVNVIFFNYVEDGLFLSSNYGWFNTKIDNLKSLGYNIDDKGYFNDYLGVNIKKQKYGTIKLMQPHLMKDIIRDVKLNRHAKIRQMPVASIKILHL